MKDTVIIKLYRNDISCSDYQDVYLGQFDAKLKELKSFAEEIGKKVYFTVCKALDCVDFDCFAEITHSGTLSETEKGKYVSIVKFFAKDAKFENGVLSIHDLPLSVLFIKAQIETL